MLKELIEDVKMKKPLARKLLLHLCKQKDLQKERTLNEQRTGQQEQVQDEDIDIDDLPIALEVVAVGRSTVASSAVDFDSMKKEIQEQMEVFP